MLEGFLSLFNSPPTFNQEQRLLKTRNLLITCTYYNNIKFIIQKICMDLMKSNPSLDVNVLAFIQNNQPRRFIQIGGDLNYQYKNKKRHVKAFMMFNQYFPNKSPYVRVVNMQNKQVNHYYDTYQSPNDPKSYVLNSKLNNLQNWNPSKSCLAVFEQIKFLLQTYPFYQDDLKQAQKIQKKNTIFQKKKPQQSKNQYIANRGSVYQANTTEQKPQQKSNIQGDYDMKQCKLCFNNISTMINLNCGHIMMCQQCFNAYKNKFRSDICQCPICKTKGQYIKYVQPKYA